MGGCLVLPCSQSGQVFEGEVEQHCQKGKFEDEGQDRVCHSCRPQLVEVVVGNCIPAALPGRVSLRMSACEVTMATSTTIANSRTRTIERKRVWMRRERQCAKRLMRRAMQRRSSRVVATTMKAMCWSKDLLL